MAQTTPYSDAPVVRDQRPSDMSDVVDDAMQSLGQRSREVSDNVQQIATQVKSALDRSLRDQPLTTLAAATVVGFVVGALWKS
jgi:ElaB/YqjD/DUF883 family membrane-anchored ribosome-binding protein